MREEGVLHRGISACFFLKQHASFLPLNSLFQRTKKEGNGPRSYNSIQCPKSAKNFTLQVKSEGWDSPAWKTCLSQKQCMSNQKTWLQNPQNLNIILANQNKHTQKFVEMFHGSEEHWNKRKRNKTISANSLLIGILVFLVSGKNRKMSPMKKLVAHYSPIRQDNFGGKHATIWNFPQAEHKWKVRHNRLLPDSGRMWYQLLSFFGPTCNKVSNTDAWQEVQRYQQISVISSPTSLWYFSFRKKNHTNENLIDFFSLSLQTLGLRKNTVFWLGHQRTNHCGDTAVADYSAGLITVQLTAALGADSQWVYPITSTNWDAQTQPIRNFWRRLRTLSLLIVVAPCSLQSD